MQTQSDKIRALNDEFRRRPSFGSVVITPGVRNLGFALIIECFKRVIAYTEFTPDNDPYGEGDFGSFEIEGAVVFFKIDTYDIDLEHLSPDASDPTVTRRILTIMLADEY